MNTANVTCIVKTYGLFTMIHSLPLLATRHLGMHNAEDQNVSPCTFNTTTFMARGKHMIALIACAKHMTTIKARGQHTTTFMVRGKLATTVMARRQHIATTFMARGQHATTFTTRGTHSATSVRGPLAEQPPTLRSRCHGNGSRRSEARTKA